MDNKKRLLGYDPITFESFTRHMTKHREPYDHYDMGYTDAIDNVEYWLDANTVDAVEVVRCKDCKYWDDDSRCNANKICLMHEYTWGDDFCSYGERRNNETD